MSSQSAHCVSALYAVMELLGSLVDARKVAGCDQRLCVDSVDWHMLLGWRVVRDHTRMDIIEMERPELLSTRDANRDSTVPVSSLLC